MIFLYPLKLYCTTYLFPSISFYLFLSLFLSSICYKLKPTHSYILFDAAHNHSLLLSSCACKMMLMLLLVQRVRFIELKIVFCKLFFFSLSQLKQEYFSLSLSFCSFYSPKNSSSKKLN